MNDADCVQFLQQALPRAGLRWPGYRKVRRQVCKRLRRRQRTLGIDSLDAYADLLRRDEAERAVFDAICRIPISRFYRDRGVFDALRGVVLPDLIERAEEAGRTEIRCWSAGCASGEEPYTLSILWRMEFADRHPTLRFAVLGTDADEILLARARDGRYSGGCLKELPGNWKQAAFVSSDGVHVLRPAFRENVVLHCQDIREGMPDGSFDLILCRNLAFTYFDDALQRRTLTGLTARLRLEGYLVIGKHERLPGAAPGLSVIAPRMGLFRRVDRNVGQPHRSPGIASSAA